MMRGLLCVAANVAIARAKLGIWTSGKRMQREFTGSGSARRRLESKRKNKTRDAKKDVDFAHPL
jgi:hypothetical protein